MKNNNLLIGIVKKLVQDGLKGRENKIQLFKNYGQMDPFYLLADDLDLDENENITSFLTNRMRGYSANIIQRKSADNRIYWQGNDELTQTDTHYLGKTLIDTLAVETGKGIQIYSSFGKPISSSDKPVLITDKDFNENLADLKNVSQEFVQAVFKAYQNNLDKTIRKDFAPLTIKKNVVERNRNYNINRG